MSLEAIEKAICEAGSDNHDVFGGTWTGGYLIQQDPAEFAQLVECLQKHGPFTNYLAIGVAAGGNERFLIENVDIGSLVVIDNGEHSNHKHWNQNKPKNFDSFFVDEFIGDSHSKKVIDFLGKYQFDLIGIDGYHSPEGVLQDWELIQPYLAPNALVWFHDIALNITGQHGARKLLARLEKEYEVILKTNGRYVIAVIRVP